MSPATLLVGPHAVIIGNLSVDIAVDFAIRDARAFAKMTIGNPILSIYALHKEANNIFLKPVECRTMVKTSPRETLRNREIFPNATEGRIINSEATRQKVPFCSMLA